MARLLYGCVMLSPNCDRTRWGTAMTAIHQTLVDRATTKTTPRNLSHAHARIPHIYKSQLNFRILCQPPSLSHNAESRPRPFIMMTTIMPFRPKLSRAIGFSTQASRWASYDKAALATEALKKHVESGLGTDKGRGNSVLDVEKKTLSTPVGDLPISPLFDPEWMKARRRQRKDNPGKPTGRFRKKLANNPYGM